MPKENPGIKIKAILCLKFHHYIKENTMVKITFEYRDTLSNWEWRTQTCTVSSVEECIRIYGLGIDCDYRIVKVEELN